MAETKINANQTSITASDIGAIQNTATGTGALTILGTSTSQDDAINIGVGSVASSYSTVIGYNANASSSDVIIGRATRGNGQDVSIGLSAESRSINNVTVGFAAISYAIDSISIGAYAQATAANSVMINTSGDTANNNVAGTFNFANTNGNYQIVSADGTIPEARLADTTNAAQGQVLTLDSNLNAVWQAGGSGGGLPSQTGNAGKFLTTDGTDASWSDKPLVNTATKTSNLVISSSSAEGLGNNICIGNNTNINSYGQGQTVIGQASQSGDSYNVIIGRACSSSGQYGVVIGSTCSSTGNNNVLIGSKLAKIASANNAILISASNNIVTNSDSNTFKVANNNGNFEIMSADGTIPTARLTKVNSTITLTAAGWSSNTQTVNVTGMTATGVVFVSPDPTDQADYTSAGILCTAQAAGTLTFTCDSVPSGDIDVNVVML